MVIATINVTQEEIDIVLDACQSSDYDNLLRVLMEHCE